MSDLTHKDIKDAIEESMIEGGYSDSTNGKGHSISDFIERVLIKLLVDKSE